MKWIGIEMAQKKRKEVEDCMRLEIQNPPCSTCIFWNPVIVPFPNKEIYSSLLKCCQAENMYSDFSCYVPKSKKIDNEK